MELFNYGAAIIIATGGGTTGGTSSTGNNSYEVVTIITMTGSFLLGLKDASVEAVHGFWQLITHPWEIAKGAKFFSSSSKTRNRREQDNFRDGYSDCK